MNILEWMGYPYHPLSLVKTVPSRTKRHNGNMKKVSIESRTTYTTLYLLENKNVCCKGSNLIEKKNSILGCGVLVERLVSPVFVTTPKNM